MTSSRDNTGPIVPDRSRVSQGPITRAIVFIVDKCTHHALATIVVAALLAIGSGYYAARHFAINTDTNDFISAKLKWRQNLIAEDKAFPQRSDQIIVVIDGKTPELAEAAAAQLADKLRPHKDLFDSVERPDGGPFFNQNGLLFLPLKETQENVQGILKAQPFITALWADPSLRGVMDGFGFINRGVRTKAGTLADFDKPIVTLADTIEDVLANRPTYFSWHAMLSQKAADARTLRRFVSIKPILDYAELEPGAKPSGFVRQTAQDLGLTPKNGVTVRLTGPVPLSDDEFSTVAEGFGLNSLITSVIVLFIIWSALKSFKIVIAVGLSVVVGLATTAAVGLMMVGALNLISVAFAVLFVGIGVDFGIQFSVRYRAERHDEPDFYKAIRMAAAKAGRPLALAAAATTCGFYAFLPTDYRGVSELGLIAGTGMLIAFAASITVLPALLQVFQPPAEEEPVGYKFLAPVDKFLADHRYWIVSLTLLVALAGTPLLRNLHFDFNPLNLRAKTVESVSTLLDLMKDPETNTNVISVLTPSEAAAEKLADRLRPLPEVARVTTLQNFVPEDQPAKLAAIDQVATIMRPLLDPQRRLDAPDDEQDVAAMRKAAAGFQASAGAADDKPANDARRLAAAITKLADAPPATRDGARKVFLPGLTVELNLLKESLEAKEIKLQSIPKSVSRDWVTEDGRARIEVAPKGDPNDNATMVRFAQAVGRIAPDATGEPVAVQESGDTVIKAFVEAGIWAVLSIAILLYIVLRRVVDVLLTLVPLLLAGLVTLEITVLIGLPLNFANIIALPLLLGLGVAFKIYFVMAWRGGTTNLLQSSLTRAVFFSAMATATAFGSLWLSKHPGTSSMGKLLALSLVCTLAAAVLFQPALMGPPRVKVTPPPSR